MKKIVSALRSRWVLYGIATALLCLLIWFVGPALGANGYYPLEPALVRVVVIAALVCLWFSTNLRRTLKARARERALIQAMAKPDAEADPEETASKEELALLGDRLREALGTLRGAKKRGLFRQSYLYELPWYMFIGPPGAGKTTALAHSGLNFPLADARGPAAVKGVGGTRNCDWWFTDDAVLIDTAGRYTTQDSAKKVDSAAWLGFLGLLKTYRRRQPINGVLVSISLSDLAILSDEERFGHARAIKARLRELHDQFGVRFPIYVLFTKCDLIAGFAEFFGNLGKEDREQVWGMTFPLDEGEDGGAVAHFGEEFDLLVDRLNEQLIERMQQEPDIGSRSLIYGFPQQFASVRDVASGFLEEIFRPSRLETRPLLRGVYFTSGTQNGTPIDRLMGAISGQFGLSRQAVTAFSGTGKSFFLHRAIKDVAFAEAGVVSVDAKLERRTTLAHRAAWAAAAAVLVLLTGAWATSYVANTALIGTANAQADRYVEQYTALVKRPQGDTDLPVLLPALATLRAMPGGYADRERTPGWLESAGLYQGYKLGSQAAAAYYRALNALLLPRLLARLETQIQGNLGNTDFLYQALKIYLILGRQGPLDPGLVQQWMDADFAGTFRGEQNAPVRQALGEHVAALLERPVTAIPLNGPLVEQVRGILRQTPLARRSYARILSSEEAQALPPWRYADHSGAAAAGVLLLRSGKSLDTGVDGIYTYAGYHDTFAKLLPDVTQDVAEDSWVLGRQDRVENDGKQIAQLRQDVLGLYLDDYVRKWDSLIADVQIVPFRSMSEGLDELNTLSGPNSPFRNLFQAFDAETQLVQVTQEGKLAAASAKLGGQEVTREAQKKISDRERRIAMMLGNVFAPGAPVIDPAQRVNDHFKWLHDFVGTPDKPGGMEAVLAKMAQIYQSFSQVAASPNAAQALLGAAAANNGASLSVQLETLGKTMPGPVQSMVKTVSQSSSTVTTSGAKQQIQDAWATKVLPLCEAALTDRYPLYENSTNDVPMDDFIKLMAPGGLIAQFFDDTLKPFVDTTKKPWKWNGVDNNQLGLSQNTLVQMQLASEIRAALFPAGGAAVALKFEISPVTLDSGVGQVSLDVDGQELTFAHGPSQPMRMQWPGPAGRNQVRLTFSPVSGASASVTKTGPWAIFRLLDTGKASSAQTDRVTYTFTGAGGSITYLVAAGSVINAFTLPALHQFRCPATL